MNAQPSQYCFISGALLFRYLCAWFFLYDIFLIQKILVCVSKLKVSLPPSAFVLGVHFIVLDFYSGCDIFLPQ